MEARSPGLNQKNSSDIKICFLFPLLLKYIHALLLWLFSKWPKRFEPGDILPKRIRRIFLRACVHCDRIPNPKKKKQREKEKKKKDKKMSTSRFSLSLAPFACFFTSSIHSLVSIYLYIYIYILSICLSIDINTIRVYYRWPTLVCLRLPQTANRNCVVRLEQKNKTKKKSREKKSLKKKNSRKKTKSDRFKTTKATA